MEVYASIHCRADIVGDSYQFFNSPHCQHSELNFDTNIKPDWYLSPDAKPKYQKSTTLAVNSVAPSYQCVGGQLSLNIACHLITPTGIFLWDDIGILPESWRVGHVVPIHKSGSQHNVANYRPISLTSVTCKVLESLIRDHILTHLFAFSTSTWIYPTPDLGILN